MTKLATWLTVTLISLLAVSGGLYFYSAYIEPAALTYDPMPFPITSKIIYPGGVATATATRCNSSSRTIMYATTRQLKRENSTLPAVVLESIVITKAPGCSVVSTRVNVVPDETLPGFYRFSGVAIVKGLLIEHEVPWQTDVFEVVARPGKETL